MKLFVSGSLAYDRIMNFDGRFGDHILPDKIHLLNVCFTVNGLQEKLGGTAGNIAYGLSQLGEKPAVLGCLGKDGQRYLDWMGQLGIDAGCVRMVDDEYTAGAFITTDQADNQITGFNPGAMMRSCGFSPNGLAPEDTLAIIAPGNLDDMMGLPELFRQKKVPFIFDPGQQLNVLPADRLADCIKGARVLISNDYELEMIMRMTGLDEEGLLALSKSIITTKGEEGSVLLEKERRVEIPAAPADEVKDPTGAGDSFRSGLIKAMAQGHDLDEACLWGAAIASFAVACYGTQEYSLEPGQFDERLAAVKELAGRA